MKHSSFFVTRFVGATILAAGALLAAGGCHHHDGRSWDRHGSMGVVTATNTVCPYCGGAIDHADAGASSLHTAEYQGERLAFCCADCLAGWTAADEDSHRAAVRRWDCCSGGRGSGWRR